MALDYERLDLQRADAVGALLAVANFLRTDPQTEATLRIAAQVIIEAADKYTAVRDEFGRRGQEAAHQTTTPDYDRADRSGE